MFDFGLYTQVSDSGPHGPLVYFSFYRAYSGPDSGGGGGGEGGGGSGGAVWEEKAGVGVKSRENLVFYLQWP